MPAAESRGVVEHAAADAKATASAGKLSTNQPSSPSSNSGGGGVFGTTASDPVGDGGGVANPLPSVAGGSTGAKPHRSPALPGNAIKGVYAGNVTGEPAAAAAAAADGTAVMDGMKPQSRPWSWPVSKAWSVLSTMRPS